MFCGWGHRRGCLCQVCQEIQKGRTGGGRRYKTIIKSSPKELKGEDMLSRPKPGELTAKNDPPFDDRLFTDCHPNLSEMLTAIQYADNAPRTTSTLLVFCENGILRGCLNDRDNNRSAFFTAQTVGDLFQTIEDALASGRADWRMKNRISTPF